MDNQSTGEANQKLEQDNETSIVERLEMGEDDFTSVFERPELLEPDTLIDEDRIVGRDDQLDAVISAFRPALDARSIPNLLLYGPSGTGKSLIINTVGKKVQQLCKPKDIDFGYIFINCERIDTVDAVAYTIVSAVADDAGVDPGVPPNGVSTKHKFDRLYELINEHYDAVLFVFDELDKLVKPKGSGDPEYSKLIYRLSRAREESLIDSQCSIAAITNNPQFMQEMDSRAESSFNPDNIDFPDYNADQLRDILEQRSDAFRPNALSGGVIPLCSALAGQSHGDARKAIDFLRNAGQLADNQGAEQVVEDHVREAEQAVDVDRAKTMIQGLSTHKKLAYYAAASTKVYSGCDYATSAVAYQVYSWITDSLNSDEMKRQTFGKYLSELETYNLLTTTRVGKGQGEGSCIQISFIRPAPAAMSALEDVDDCRVSELDEQTLETVVEAQVREHDMI